MNRTSVEKLGTVGAVVAALACPICFPKLALIGAALGLGIFAPYERYIAARRAGRETWISAIVLTAL